MIYGWHVDNRYLSWITVVLRYIDCLTTESSNASVDIIYNSIHPGILNTVYVLLLEGYTVLYVYMCVNAGMGVRKKDTDRILKIENGP